MRSAASLVAIVALAALTMAAAAAGTGADGASGGSVPVADGPVVVMTIDGAIGPATADHLHRALAHAARLQARLAVLRIDTPGGLDLSMRSIIRDILASTVPVAAYVAPDGARAASAGTYIVYASHLAAMAPASNLGAATPVAIGLPLPGGGGRRDDEPSPTAAPAGSGASSAAPASAADAPPRRAAAPAAVTPHGDPMAAKRIADASAYLRSLAQLRGRNADWAERAVRESVSLSSAEALQAGVIDLVARDLPDLLRQLDGRSVAVAGGRVTLATRDAAVTEFAADWRSRLLSAIADPSLALLLILVGLGGLLLEFSTPGLVVPGVVGAIGLLLGLYALQLLPFSYAGLALVLLGAALLTAEAFVPSFGALGLGGLAAFAFGALMLVDTDSPGYGVPWPLVALLAVLFAAFVFGVAAMAARARRRPPVGGGASLLGAVGELIEFEAGEGWAVVRGVPWKVRSVDDATLLPGSAVRVTALDGLVLSVVAAPAPAEPVLQRPAGRRATGE